MLASLRGMVQDLEVYGVGGDELAAQGMRPLFHVRDFNVMGLVEVLSQLKRLKGIFAELVDHVRQNPPDVIVLIDAPDFNLRFAKAVKDLGIPIIYYVSPQVWAWRKKRAHTIASLVDHIMVLFEFEKPIFEDLGLATTWTGHPLIDELGHTITRQDFFHECGLDPYRPLVAIAPGSRPSEIKRHLPVFRELALARRDQYQFALPVAPALDTSVLSEGLGNAGVHLLPGKMRPLMRHCDAAVVASGTATLETALLRTPMIVGYRLKNASYWMAKLLVKVPHISLVNIVLNEAVVPELIQQDFSAKKILPILDELMQGGSKREAMLKAFDRLEKALGGSGASERAALVVKDFLIQ